MSKNIEENLLKKYEKFNYTEEDLQIIKSFALGIATNAEVGKLKNIPFGKATRWLANSLIYLLRTGKLKI